MTPFLSELSQLIRQGQVDPARSLLAQFPPRPAAEKAQVIELLALAEDAVALPLLDHLLGGSVMEPEIQERLFQLTTDRAHLNFAFAQLLMDHGTRDQLNTILPLFKHILTREKDPRRLADLLKGLGKHRLDDLSATMAEFLFYDDPRLKAEAVRALERTAGPNALDCLIQVSKTEKSDADVLDAIEIIQNQLDTSGAIPEKLTASPRGHDPLRGMLDQLTRPDVQARHRAFDHFSTHPEDLEKTLSQRLRDHIKPGQLILLEAAGRCSCPGAFNDLLTLVSDATTPPAIRFAAHTALGHLPELESSALIIQDVTHSALAVRTAALMALDKNLSDFTLAEIRSRVESGTRPAQTLAQCIVDSRCRNLIHDLMVSDPFVYAASNHLENAPIPALETFIQVLEARKMKSTLNKYRQLLEKRQGETQKPWVALLGTSQPYLRVMERQVQAAGFQALAFTHCQEAFEALVSEKPAGVISDLFLDEMTATDMAREIREIYPPAQLPVMISSSHVPLAPAAMAPGLNSPEITQAWGFPAQPRQIKEAIAAP
ncbi:MAG: hypothetical protein MI747_23500 [Desulfobacterales bacterium]|nr:hypothetical protein [Desulfobacterales bacterium]